MPDSIEAAGVITGTGRTTARPRDAFFMAMSLALLVCVLVGFAPTYYLKSYFGTPELRWQLQVHGAVLSTWYLLLFVQTCLVAAHRTDIHRRLGVFAVVVACVLVPVTATVRVETLGLTIPFVGMVGTGAYFRRRPDVHKRLMVLASTMLVGAAIARASGRLVQTGIVSFPMLLPIIAISLVLPFLVALVVYDLITLRRLHPATLWGGIAVLLARRIFGDFPSLMDLIHPLAH
jgi:hypothetical protein